MKKIRRWFDKTSKEVSLLDGPLTSDTCHGVSALAETLCPSPKQRDVLSLVIREQLARVQAEEWPAGGGAGQLPVTSSSQEEQAVTWEPHLTSDPILYHPEGGGASPPVLLLKTRNSSLPSSPLLDRRMRRLPASLPSSPLLGGRARGSSPSPGISRLWVEAALQRSRNVQPRTHAPPPPPPLQGEGQFCQPDSCKCLRCPSAPPFEAELWAEIGRSLRDTAPPDGDRLYPSLSLWTVTGGSQEHVFKDDLRTSHLILESE